MQLEIKHLHDELGVTIVYVTHDQSEALTMSDRIAVFHHGTHPAARHRRPSCTSGPANAFVASFIGENNRFDGTLVARDGQRCRVRLADGTRDCGACIDADLAVGVGRRAVAAPRACDHRRTGRAPTTRRRELLEVIYLGDHCKLRLRVGGQRRFHRQGAGGRSCDDDGARRDADGGMAGGGVPGIAADGLTGGTGDHPAAIGPPCE